MSLSLANKIFNNAPLTWAGEFYTIKEITCLNENQEIVNATIVGMVDKNEYGLTCTYQEFREAIK